MTIGAVVIALQATATYLALGSSYFFAKPFLRSQAAQASLQLLESAIAHDTALDAVRRAAVDVFRDRLVLGLPHDRRANYLGVALLIASFIAFSVAIILQGWSPAT
jgi:hypothetical protein